MVLMHPLPVLIHGIEGGALASTTGAKAWIGGAHRVEYSYAGENHQRSKEGPITDGESVA